ncbi:MAG: aminoglycoside phosphotransferase family protein [Alicyclobacillus sp.]|nr:aminoglycoside phosphotransferase family protein [Alicyclobacillus sp.]
MLNGDQAQDLDSAAVQRWSERLQERVVRVSRLAVTPSSQVYRIYTERSGSRIGKVAAPTDRFTREAELDDLVVRRLPVWTPRVVGHGREADAAWIVYEDLGLRPAPRTVYAFLKAVRVSAQLHMSVAEVQVPALLQESHTPDLAVAATHLLAIPWSDFAAWLRAVGVRRHAVNRLHHLYERVPAWLPALQAAPIQLVHGDLHYGNLLYAPAHRQWCIIDWEFVHQDTVYFDLFQLLDATSPTAQLERPCPRLMALCTYVHSAAQVPNPLVRAKERWGRSWLRGYLHYAAIYLFWILTRIHADFEQQKFTKDMLRRQLAETVKGLLSIASDLSRLNTR